MYKQWATCAALGLGTLIVALSKPLPLRAQVLEGRLIDATSRLPVGHGNITVLRDGQSPLNVGSDSLGRFRIALPTPGSYALRVERIGYLPLTTKAIPVAINELLELELRLDVNVIPLNPLVITSRRSAAPSHADFDRRLEWGRNTGSGHYITRADLDVVRLPFLSSYLVRLPRVALRTRPDPPYKTHVMLNGDCFPAVYLNGVPLQLADARTSIDDIFDTKDVEGIEVYSRRGDIPPEYARPDICGVVIAWTRLPQAGARGSRVRLIVGGSMFVGFLALWLL